MIKISKSDLCYILVIWLSTIALAFFVGAIFSISVEMIKGVDGKATTPVVLCSELSSRCYDPVGRIISF